MLRKLIKYDIRSTWREFAGAYLAILLGVLLLPPLFNTFSNDIVDTVGGFIIVGIVIATIVVMVGTLFRIFNKNVFSKEGYLTMTLPVTSAQIVISKLLVSTMWIICTSIVAAIGISIFVMNLQAVPKEDMMEGIQKLLSLIDNRGALATILVLIAMLLSSVKEIAKLFLACSVAHLKQIGRFRTAIGIFTYFALSWIETLIVQAVTFVAAFIPGIHNWVLQFDQFEQIEDPSSFSQFLGLFNGVMALGILYSMLLVVAFSIGTIWLLNRKLDLD